VFERFDEDALRAVLASQEAARELSAAQIGSGHLLVGLVSKEWFASAQVLTMLGVMSSEIREAIGLPMPIEDRHRTGPHISLDRSVKRTVKQSTKEAGALRSDRIGTEHLLLALLRVGEGGGARVLNERGVSYAVTMAAMTERQTSP
jgi:ATP-dependent Clp protease ATP-binding subunit ClpA